MLKSIFHPYKIPKWYVERTEDESPLTRKSPLDTEGSAGGGTPPPMTPSDWNDILERGLCLSRMLLY